MKIHSYPDQSNAYLAEHIDLLERSYFQLLGESLLANRKEGESLAEQLFYAPFILLSHDISADPLFNYANKAALELFEIEWQQLIRTPSRLSAEPVNQEQRERLLAQVSKSGFISNYQGIRISQTGKRFRIKNAVVWNLFDRKGEYQGQAACFSDWQLLD